MKCLICGIELLNKRALARHLWTAHKMSTKQYSITFLFNGKEPKCPICKKETRYVSFSFKKYCKEHSSFAEREAGRIGGKLSPAWNKGQTKETNTILKELSERYSGEGNPFFGKTHKREICEKISEEKTLSEEDYNNRTRARCDFEILTPYLEYSSRQHQYLEVVCKKCGQHSQKTLQSIERNSPCFHCLGGQSIPEQEIADFVATLGFSIERNTRKVISPFELDIFVPDKNLAIEYNGFYWHSEGQKRKTYHQEKTDACAKQNIQLIHIWPDQWRDKQEIIKSMIRARLGITETTIFARKCSVAAYSANKDISSFFNANHISGHTQCKQSFVLVYDGEMVAALSLRKPFHKKYADKIEIARFAVKRDTNLPGAFSRLLKAAKEWSAQNHYSAILTYADLSYGTGQVYSVNEFQEIAETPLSYWYTDGVNSFNRFKFRAQKGETEKQVALKNNVWKIYGCKSKIYLTTLPTVL